MAEPEISVVTGEPIGAPTVNAQTGLEDVSVVTGEPLESVPLYNKSRMGTQDDPLQGIMGGERYKNLGKETVDDFTKYGVTLGRNLDWRDQRARNQSTAEQWWNGYLKMGITTVSAVVENTIGVFAGLYAVNEKGKPYYDNAIGRAVDNVNEWAR